MPVMQKIRVPDIEASSFLIGKFKQHGTQVSRVFVWHVTREGPLSS